MKMKLKLEIEFDAEENQRNYYERRLLTTVAQAIYEEFYRPLVKQLKTSIKHLDLPSPPAEELKI